MVASGEGERGTIGTASKMSRIVLADDDADFRDYAALVLRGAGYDVVEARDGASLLECIDFSSYGRDWVAPFDAVVADFRMPGVTGIEVLEALADAGLAGHVVLVSGFADPETLRWADRIGAAAALSKPFSAEQLLQAVHKATQASPEPADPAENRPQGAGDS